MYVRQLAWYHATPDKAKSSRIESKRKTDPDYRMLMPNITNVQASYIIDLLLEAGLMSQNGMGPVPLSWSEIHSWLNCTRRSIPHYELMLVKELSESYVSELNKASDVNAQMPYTDVVTVDRDAVQKKILDFAARFNAARNKNTTENERLE